MTPHQYVGLFVRLFAIWLLFVAVQSIGLGVALSQFHTTAPYVIAALQVLVAILIWCFPMLVAHKLVPPTEAPTTAPISAVETAAIACIVLGLWLCVARVFPALAKYISLVLVMIHDGDPLITMGARDWGLFVESGIEFAVALALVFKARSIAIFLLAPRAKGRVE